MGLADAEDFTAGDRAAVEGCVMPSLRKAIDRRFDRHQDYVIITVFRVGFPNINTLGV